MIALIQRVTSASVVVDDRQIANIGDGILAFIGVERDDTEQRAQRMLQRLSAYRIFSDREGRVNLSVVDIEGALLLVPQFTLLADTRKGNRPGFSGGADPEHGERVFEYLVTRALEGSCPVQVGQFGAHMAVHLVNDGPMTFWLSS